MQVADGWEKQDRANYERLRIHMTHSVWRADLKLAEIIKLKGSFFKNMGFSLGGISYLYLEEVQHLSELQQVYLEVDGQILDREGMYNLVLKSMPHACYLTYMKLKVIRYLFILMHRQSNHQTTSIQFRTCGTLPCDTQHSFGALLATATSSVSMSCPFHALTWVAL